MDLDDKTTGNPSGVESEHAAADGSVGYCRPPKATRFEAGRSGNPKGRLKGSLNSITE